MSSRHRKRRERRDGSTWKGSRAPFAALNSHHEWRWTGQNRGRRHRRFFCVATTAAADARAPTATIANPLVDTCSKSPKIPPLPLMPRSFPVPLLLPLV